MGKPKEHKKQSFEEFQKEYFEQNKERIKANIISDTIIYIMFILFIAFVVYIEIAR